MLSCKHFGTVLLLQGRKELLLHNDVLVCEPIEVGNLSWFVFEIKGSQATFELFLLLASDGIVSGLGAVPADKGLHDFDLSTSALVDYILQVFEACWIIFAKEEREAAEPLSHLRRRRHVSRLPYSLHQSPNYGARKGCDFTPKCVNRFDSVARKERVFSACLSPTREERRKRIGFNCCKRTR